MPENILIRNYFALLITVMIGIALPAQEVVYNNYTLSEGLMSQTVYCAMQGNDGYVWFGTDAGVSRFDGFKFENFTTDDGLCDNEVLRINQDSKGRIWFLSLSGCLAYFYDGQINSAINDPSLQTEIQTLGMSCFGEDKQGGVWFSGMDTRVVRFQNGKADVIQFNKDNYKGIRSNIYLYHDKDGELYIQDHALIGRLDDQHQIRTIPNDKKRPLPNCFYDGPNGAFVLSDDGLYDFQTNSKIELPGLFAIQEIQKAIGLSVGDAGIWISSGDLGVFHWIKRDDAWVFDRKYFDDDWVNYVMEDCEGNTWFCTRDHGICCILPTRRDQYYINLPDEYQATSFAADNGILYFGTGTGKLYKLLPHAGHAVELLCDFGTGNGVEDLMQDGDGNLIVRTSKGAHIFTPERNTPYEMSNLHPKVMHDGRDGKLYFSLLSGVSYIEKFNLKPPWNFKRIVQIPSGRIYNLFMDDQRGLWFENHDKLLCLKDSVVTEVENFNAVSRGRISTITGTPSQDILLSTMGSGLYLLHNSQIQSLSRDQGLPSNECEWVRVFGNSAWVLTSAGLVRCALEGHSIRMEHHYSTADGIPDAKIYDVFELEGVLYLATHKGLFFLPTQSPPHKAIPPRVHITDVWCNGVHQKAGDVRLPYGESLKLDFTAITFDMPESSVFQYMFDNTGNSWTTTSNRSIEISSLDWGEHTFQVRARKYDSDWSDPVSIQISVLPPVWATWWFRILMAAVMAGLVYLLFVFIARRKYKEQLRVLEQQQALLRERNRISTDLHDDIGAELSNIVILSRIARTRIDANDNPADYIRKIDSSASEVISKMNGIIWSLNPSNDNLQNLTDYIKRYAQDYLEMSDKSGRVVLEGTPDKSEVKALVRRNTFLIVKEALHNVTKHAQAERVDILIYIRPHEMVIEIVDNGRGFDTSHSRPDGLGLGSMKARAADMGGSLILESKTGAGTRLILKIPR